MPYDYKEEYLNKKYAEHDDEQCRYKHKKKKTHVKKSKHKHDYVNCVVVSEGKEYFVSRCSICGKLSEFKHDDALSKMFPDLNRRYLVFFLYFNSFENSEAVKEWCLENYQVFHVDNFDQFKDKYI